MRENDAIATLKVAIAQALDPGNNAKIRAESESDYDTLARPWKEKDRTMWEIHQIVSILAQSLRALAILHDSPNPVIHRDLKPSNILVAYRAFGPDTNEIGPWIKLADFGIAVEGIKCHTQRGTWIYTAPEVFGPGRYSSEVDIWSLSVVIVQLLLEGNIPESSGKKPQGPVWCKDIIANVLSDGRVPQQSYQGDEELYGSSLL